MSATPDSTLAKPDQRIADLERQLADREAELAEAREQQAATAEILEVINSSPGGLAPVFDAILEKATRLCEAPFGILRTWDGERFHFGAVHGDPRFCDWVRQRGPIRTDSDASLLGRIQAGERIVHITDAQNDEAYQASAGFREMAEASGIRSAITVTLHKDDTLLGIITVYRREVRPFSDKQIALLQNFAAQAVIAMENARLITETREALEQQTATAEVLQVINSSPGDLVPVFEAILEKAHDLCGATLGSLRIVDGDYIRSVATRGHSALFAEEMREGSPVSQAPIAKRLLNGEPIVHIPDLAAADDPFARRSVERSGVRTALAVPLRKDNTLLGMIFAGRQEVRPFSDKQIALLQNFAAQAVIAMENARLITETREALEQQTATAEVLGVINASPGDLEPVFDAMLDKAMALCGIAHGGLQTYDGQQFRAVSVRGLPEPLAALLRQGYRPSRGHPMLRLLEGDRFVQIPDLMQVAPELGDVMRIAVEAGDRTLLYIPLRKDDVLLGVIVAVRREVRPFSEKVIALLENFAAQAVIAMENARLLTETREALAQQTATAEILGVINSSPGDLGPVFDAVLEKATALCEAAFGGLSTFDGDRFVPMAAHAVPSVYADFRSKRGAFSPPPGSSLDRVAKGESIVHVADVATDAAQAATPLVELGGCRTLICVALRKDDALIGAMTVYRQEVRPFTDKQIALLENFAAHAVIAMENARLITEMREALEQQTATAEVLQVINSSPGDLAPVFDAILEKAHTLCGAAHGSLTLAAGEHCRAVATRGMPEEFATVLRRPFHPGLLGERLSSGEPFVQIADITATPTDSSVHRAAVGPGGVRTLLAVPLRKDGALLGYITANRQEVRPFSDKQIAVLQNFAAQAVIAMENARLITETREALEQQTATAEVLQVINSSPGDLAPVFDAILAKAHTLCGADHGGLVVYDGKHFRGVAEHGLPAQFTDLLRKPFRPEPGSFQERLLRGDSLVHVADVTTLDMRAVDDLTNQRRRASTLAGIRTLLFLPLRKEKTLLG